jgi:uncharacterized protein (DUF1684 family)
MIRSGFPAFSRRAAGLVSTALTLALGAALVLPLLGATKHHASPATRPAGKDAADLAAWRAQRAKDLTAPDGWFSLVGLEWLKPGKNSIGQAADNTIQIHGHAPAHLAVVDVDGSQLKLEPPAGGFPKVFLEDGKAPQTGPLQSDDVKPTLLTTENLSLVVLHRGDRYALRVKDAQAATRTGFKGLRWYPPDARYRITARWIPFTPAHTEKIPTIIGTTLDMPAPGLAEFTLNGKTIQLEPVLEAPDAKELFFILRDATSHTTTYEAARFLYTSFPDHGLTQPGQIVLDFNRLQNPPCAYTPYATCPLPPYVNRLSVSIPAGEQRYSR